MDKTILVKDDILEGKKLIQHLETTNFQVNSALWFYNSELGMWRLILASEYLDRHGPKEAYAFVQKELEKVSPIDISLNNITIVGANDELINLLRRVVETGDKDIMEMRLVGNAIDGVMVEDVLIYRIT